MVTIRLSSNDIARIYLNESKHLKDSMVIISRAQLNDSNYLKEKLLTIIVLFTYK